MSYLDGPFFAQYYCDYIEANGAVLNIVSCKEITGCAVHSDFLGVGDGRLGRTKTLVRPGLYLDKDDSPVSIHHNQVDFTGPAGKVTCELFKAFTFKEPQAPFFTPSAEQLLIGQQPAFVQQQIRISCPVSRILFEEIAYSKFDIRILLP